jgi:hypothetical protein
MSLKYKTVCKKEFQVKLRTFHQLKTNDFDDGGLDDHWGPQFFVWVVGERAGSKAVWRNFGENLKY